MSKSMQLLIFIAVVALVLQTWEMFRDRPVERVRVG